MLKLYKAAYLFTMKARNEVWNTQQIMWQEDAYKLRHDTVHYGSQVFV